MPPAGRPHVPRARRRTAARRPPLSALLSLALGEIFFILTFPDTLTTQRGYRLSLPMVFEHSGGRDFDLPRHSHYSGVIPMVFEHSAGGRDFEY